MENIIIDVINNVTKKTETRGRKPKHDNRFYLRKIVYVLNSDSKWNYLDGEDVHFTTIYKRFRKWSVKKVFEIAHNKIIQMINDKYYSENRLATMYMDSVDILNKLEPFGSSRIRACI